MSPGTLTVREEDGAECPPNVVGEIFFPAQAGERFHYLGAEVRRDADGRLSLGDLGHIDELARRLGSLVPPGLKEGREELQQNFKSVLQSGLGRLDLVTREEFDVQRQVLLRTREQLEALQRTVAELEAQLAAARGNDTPQA